MNLRTSFALSALLVLTIQLSAQEEYPDTITLISGKSQIVRIDKIGRKGKTIDFYIPDDPKLKSVKVSSVDTFIIAADIPYYRALKFFYNGKASWHAEGNEIYKEADSDDLNRRIDAWLDQPSKYLHTFTSAEEFEAGVISGSGQLRLNVSTFLNYDMTIQTFGNNYSYRISDPTLSTGVTMQEYIRTNCFKSNGSANIRVSDYSKSIVTTAAIALEEIVQSLKMKLAE